MLRQRGREGVADPANPGFAEAVPVLMVQEATDNDTCETPLQWGACYLATHYAERIGRSILTNECARSTARLRLQAAAEHITLQQHKALQENVASCSENGQREIVGAMPLHGALPL